MARSLNIDDVKRGDLLRVWPEDLVVNPAKRGRCFPPTQEDVESLAAKIAAMGQLQAVPVTVTFDKRLELAAGFTRWESITWLNSQPGAEKRRIECKVIDANEEEAFMANLSENRDRNATSVIDDAHNIRRMSEQFHKTDEEIMAFYGTPKKPMSPSWLEGMRSLVRLPKADQRRIHDGEISKSQGLQLAAMDPAKREQTLEIAQADGGKLTTTSVLKAARQTGALSGPKALKMPEVKGAWEYMVSEGKTEKERKLGKILLDYQANKLPEPDFFQAVRRLFS